MKNEPNIIAKTIDGIRYELEAFGNGKGALRAIDIDSGGMIGGDTIYAIEVASDLYLDCVKSAEKRTRA